MKTAYDIAKYHLDSLPPAISGDGGHKTTFRAACWLVKCGLGDGDALALLREYSQRCQPPWTEKELRHKLADARRKVLQRINLAPSSAQPVRLVWKVSPSLRCQPNATPQPKPALAVSIPGETVELRQPWITKSGDLVIPFDSPPCFHWWKDGGMSPSETRYYLEEQVKAGQSWRVRLPEKPFPP